MKKSKHYTREFRNDDPTTYLTDVEQQKNVLLDTLDDAKAKPKKVNTYVEPEMNDLDHIAESRLKYEERKTKRKPPEFFEKNNSNVDSGLAGILSVNKRLKGKE